MRKCDLLSFDENGIAYQFGKDEFFHQEQIARQIKKLDEEGFIETGMLFSELGSSSLTYVFHLKDYEKRKKRNMKCAILIGTSKNLYDEYDVTYVILNQILHYHFQILEMNPNLMDQTIILQKEQIPLKTKNLKNVLAYLREKRLEEKLENSLLEQTIRLSL